MADDNVSLLDPALLRSLEQLSLATRRPLAGQMKGEKRSIRKGTSIEFADYRDYTVGDDLRYVDWNSAARLDKLYLKLFVEEEDLYLALLLDSSKSMAFGEPSKLGLATRLAAALGYIGLTNHDRVCVQCFGTSAASPLPTQRGRVGVVPLFKYLDRQQPAGSTKLEESLRRFAAGSKRKGVAIVLSDLFDPGWQAGLKALFLRGFQVTVIHVLALEELSPTLLGDLRVIDSETGESREMSVNTQLIARYRERAESFRDEVESFCHRYGADYLRVVTTDSVEDIVLKSLRTSGVVR